MLSILSLLFAVTHAQPVSPEVQGLYTKLLQEVQASVQCTIREGTLKQENERLKAQIEELKKTHEKAPD